MAETTQCKAEQKPVVRCRVSREENDRQTMSKSRLSTYDSLKDIIRPRHSIVSKKRGGLTTLLCCSRNIESEDEISSWESDDSLSSKKSLVERRGVPGYGNDFKEGESRTSDTSEFSRRSSQERSERCKQTKGNTRCSAVKNKCIMGRKSPYLLSNRVPSRVSEETSHSEDESDSKSDTSEESDAESSEQNVRKSDLERKKEHKMSGEKSLNQTTSFKELLMQNVDTVPLQASGILDAICSNTVSFQSFSQPTKTQQGKGKLDLAVHNSLREMTSSLNWASKNTKSKAALAIEDTPKTIRLEKGRNSVESDVDRKRGSSSESSGIRSQTNSSESINSLQRGRGISRDRSESGEIYNGNRTRRRISAWNKDRVRRKAIRRDRSESSEDLVERKALRRDRSDSSEDRVQRKALRRDRSDSSEYYNRERRRRNRENRRMRERDEGRVRSKQREISRRTRRHIRGRHRRISGSRSARSLKRVKHRRRSSPRRCTDKYRRKKSRKSRRQMKNTGRSRYRSRYRSDSENRSCQSKHKARRKHRHHRRHAKGMKHKHSSKSKKEWISKREVLFGSPASFRKHLCDETGHRRDSFRTLDESSQSGESSESPERKSLPNRHLYDMRRRRRRSKGLSPARFRTDGRKDKRPEWDNRF